MIAETIAQCLGIEAVSLSPEQAAAHFGWMGYFMGRDVPSSSALTQERLGWHPTQIGLIEDLHLALAS